VRAGRPVDAAHDAVRAFLARHPSADGGTLIFGETGQARKGTTTAAAGRQYSGTMGRVENVIVAVHAAYAASRGHALIDRDLYARDGRPAGDRQGELTARLALARSRRAGPGRAPGIVGRRP
jgi:SRSO17 transposase